MTTMILQSGGFHFGGACAGEIDLHNWRQHSLLPQNNRITHEETNFCNLRTRGSNRSE